MKNRTTPILPFILGLFAWLLYESTNAHGLFWGDAGEFMAISNILGIGHAYGHPLFWLLGRAAILLAPGDPAAAMNHLTAVFSALTCGFSVVLALRWIPKGLKDCQKWMAVSLPVLVLITSEVIWGQATFTEVYNIQALFIILALIYLDKYFRDGKDIRHICAAAYFWAISFTLGLYAGLLIVLPLIFLLLSDNKKTSLPSMMWIILALLLGFSIWLYLPVRSSAKPPFMHSNINSLQAFINYMGRTDYTSRQIAGPAAIPFFLRKSIQILLTNLNIAGGLLLIAGLFFLIREKNKQLVPYVLTTGLLVLIFGTILPLTLNFRQAYGMNVYFTPILLLCIPVLTSGAVWLIRQTNRIIVPAILLIAIVPGILSFPTMNLNRKTLTERYLDFVQSALPEGASIAANSDETHYPLLFEVYANGNPNQFNLWYIRDLDQTDTWMAKLKNSNTVAANYGPHIRAIPDFDSTAIAGPFFTSSRNDSVANELNDGFLELFSLDVEAIQQLHPVERMEAAVLWQKRSLYWLTWSERLKFGNPKKAGELLGQAMRTMYKAYEFDDFSYMASFYAGNLANMMLQAGQLNDAESFAKQGLSKYPFSLESQKALAAIYALTDRPEKANKIRNQIKKLEKEQ